MSKIAVVYWSGTGNTEEMAKAVAKGAEGAGAEVALKSVEDFSASELDGFDAIAFGCPAMGAEELEPEEFEPVFNDCEQGLKGKKAALFGSYGWGDGEWMRDWDEKLRSFGAEVAGDYVICQEAPDDDAVASCEALGAKLV